MHGAAILVMTGALLMLAGCAEMDACKAYPTESAAYRTCVNAVSQRQSERQDRQLRLEFRGKQ